VSGGPWNRDPDDEPPSQRRFWLWIAVLAAGAIGLWLLFGLFPGQPLRDWDWANLIWLVGLLTAASTWVLASRRMEWRETMRNIGLWLGVVAVLAVGYVYQDDLALVWQRVRGELVPGAPVEVAPHVMAISEDRDGGFSAYGEVNGTQVKFLIDTGASEIVLSPGDARRIGIDVDALTFDMPFVTANGPVAGARVRLASLTVGAIRLTDVPAIVNRAEMDGSLLGMSFLRRLDGFEIRGRRMLLKWH
jgi:aspartyl protease family protein